MGKLQRPMPAEKVIESIGIISKKTDFDPIERGLKGAIIGILDSLLGSRDSRNALLFRLFPGKWDLLEDISSNDLSEGEWYALKRWVGPNKPEGEKWQGVMDFITECAQLNYYLDIKTGGEKAEEETFNNAFFEEFCNGRFGHIPEMACGHPATDLTALFKPFHAQCADGGKNKLAYQAKADQSLMELDKNGNIDK